LLYRTRLTSNDSVPYLRGHLYHRTGRELYHPEPNSVISAELIKDSIESATLDAVPVDSTESNRRIFKILVYKALRKLFRSKGYVCGSTGSGRSMRFQNMCLERLPLTTVQGSVLGRCHQGFQFHVEMIQGSLALTLVPHLNLTTSFAEAGRRLPNLRAIPHTFVAFDYDFGHKPLYNTFLAPYQVNGSYVESGESSEMVVLHLANDAELPLSSLYLLLSTKDQRLLGLSEQFGYIQTHRYAGREREFLLKTLLSLSRGNSWFVELAPGIQISFESSFIKV
jgi:hypothetical protein